jgi:hypothetical protein
MVADSNQIKSVARTVFVRHGVDADRISIQASRDRVSIRGHIRFLPAKAGKTGGIKAADLLRMDQELRAKREIKHVRWQLENFRHDGGSFTALADRGGARKKRGS